MAASGESSLSRRRGWFLAERKRDCNQNVSPPLGTALCLPWKLPGDKDGGKSKGRHHLLGIKAFLQRLSPHDAKDYQTHPENWALFFILPQLFSGGNRAKIPLFLAPLSGQVTFGAKQGGWAGKLLRAGEPGPVQPAVSVQPVSEKGFYIL